MNSLAELVLRTVARHHAVDEGVVAARHASVDRREIHETLRRLADRGLVAQTQTLRSDARCFWITDHGGATIDHQLPAPVVTAERLRGDVAAGWVWVLAADGRFPDGQVLTERDMIARDQPLLEAGYGAGDPAGPCGLRVSGAVERNASGRHHPSVGIFRPSGWAAAEVLLGWPDPRRLSALLAAYGADARYRGVRFLVEDARIAREVESVISARGLSESAAVSRLPFGL